MPNIEYSPEKNIKEYIKQYVDITKAYFELLIKITTLDVFKEQVGHEVQHKFVIVQVGDNPASSTYVRGKVKDCEEVGINVDVLHLPETISQEDLALEICKLNTSPSVTGYIVQLPLPEHIDEKAIKDIISKEKDADGFKATTGDAIQPCTPSGIIYFLQSIKFNFESKNALVIGRSDIVGKPMARMLLEQNCSVTVCHSKTPKKELKKFIKNADLIVCAVGKQHMLTNEYNYKNDCIIVDVGINRDENGKLCGDCDENLPVAIQTPVPGGVGLLTRLVLLSNFLKLIAKQCA